jgi:hypothetical protein
MATTLSVGVPYKVANKKTTSKVLVQLNIGSVSPLYLYGSLDGTNYVQLDSFSAGAIKEVAACPYLSFSAVTGDHDNTTTAGTSSVIIHELTGY